jgi:paraquat-inducible protein B
MADPERPLPPVPEARAVPRKKTRLSMVWIVPIAAAVVGAWVAVTAILGAGPKITIVFDSAEGLEAGKTKLHYNGVDVGTLTAIHLADDHTNVVATVQMAPKTEDFLVDDSKFWVVRPRISGANVSGLGTLISGAYVGVEIGRDTKPRREFTALKVPPVVGSEVEGRYFVLKTRDLGSLDTGTPLFFRRLPVGEVAAYSLDADGKTLTVRVFVRAPYDKYVGADTRFWQASGIDLSLAATGLSVKTQSLLSILIGGIAFEAPAVEPVAREAAAESVFTLFDDRKAAFELPTQNAQDLTLIFKQSVRGLSVGAPVEFNGIPIGEVVAIQAQVDLATADFSIPVTIRVDAAKFGVKLVNQEASEDRAAAQRRVMDLMVARGLRAQLKSGSLLTGALFVAVDFIKDAPPAAMDWTQKPALFPTIPGGFEELESTLASIMTKLDALPVEAIGADLRKSLADLDALLVSAHGTVDHVDDVVVNKIDKLPFQSIGDELNAAIKEFDRTLVSARRALDDAGALVQPDSTLAANLTATLQGVSRAARDLGLLLDYLERHPEALIRGKSGEGK